MSHPVSIDAVKAKLNDRLDDLMAKLCPNAVKVGNEWEMGSIRGEPGQSFKMNRSGKKLGLGYDFAEGRYYDILDVVAAAKFDGDIGDAIAWAIALFNLGRMTPAEIREQEEKAKRQRAEAEKGQAEDAEAVRRKAKGLYLAGEPWEGSPVERYLLGRRIDLKRFDRSPRALRWHGRVWNREAGGVELPAMLAPIVDAISGEHLGTHRTWLDLLADGRVTKAALREPKMSWGAYRGGVIPLLRGESGKPLKQMPADEWVICAEGIENALSAALMRPQRRAIAAVSLSNLAEIRLPPQLGGLFLVADNDTKSGPQKQFARACARLEERGVRFQIVRPPEGIKDFNDWLAALERQAEQGRVA
ncbi:MAG: toprim domain-containing protein [Bosea sp.]|uniref:DUF7146 domain-containing protein n=1 Tax=unclassified Bosea (in: a-proteobacteria) TaxID=2653178 RepID=UPI0009657A2D|nr:MULTISPECIES: toprim domain-containing protein [unclassified Bosea (in: a-proteobacteria)]MBN9458498.1 toprim domain-containing protein [Bosea sp. (in: a-proteobacteria)]OJV06801.1 MAG: hypothetical protein BGO20_00100 [Bosea sp. 67-29]